MGPANFRWAARLLLKTLTGTTQRSQPYELRPVSIVWQCGYDAFVTSGGLCLRVEWHESHWEKNPKISTKGVRGSQKNCGFVRTFHRACWLNLNDTSSWLVCWAEQMMMWLKFLNNPRWLSLWRMRLSSLDTRTPHIAVGVQILNCKHPAGVQAKICGYYVVKSLKICCNIFLQCLTRFSMGMSWWIDDDVSGCPFGVMG